MKAQFIFVLLAALICFFSLPSVAQQQSPPPISVQNIKGSIYQVKGGSGANTGFFIADKEVLVIDAKMTDEAAKQMLAEIKKVSANPVTRIVLTHSDGDHVNGLVGFPPGLEIISHGNAREDMKKAFESPQQKACLPTETFSTEMNLYYEAGGKSTRVDLLHFGPAHTNGDVVVYFPGEKVAFIGDLLFLERDPLIHRAKHGTSFGLVKVLNALLALDVETYASGHNELTTKKEIQSYLQGITEKQTRIQAMVKEGKTLEEVKKAFNISTPAGGSRWPSLVEVIYLDITEMK